MAKVYDALRRAEAERRRRAPGRTPARAGPLEWEPEASPSIAPPPAVARASFWSRLWPTRRRVAARDDRRPQQAPHLAAAAGLLRGRAVPRAARADRRDRRGARRCARSPSPARCPARARPPPRSTSPSSPRSPSGAACCWSTATCAGPRCTARSACTPEAGLAEVLTDQIGLERGDREAGGHGARDPRGARSPGESVGAARLGAHARADRGGGGALRPRDPRHAGRARASRREGRRRPVRRDRGGGARGRDAVRRTCRRCSRSSTDAGCSAWC